MPSLTYNRRAQFDYELTDHYVAGLELLGHEVKSLKAHAASLKGAFVILKGGQAYLMGSHVTPYQHASGAKDIDPTRSRRLLLHRRELQKLIAAKDSGFSLVPISLFEQRGLVKLELAVGRGKKRYDKRQSLKRQAIDRDTSRQLAHMNRKSSSN